MNLPARRPYVIATLITIICSLLHIGLASGIAHSATSMNVAAQANGGAAVASSVRDTGHAAAHAINGDRKGLNWGSTGGWGDATSTFPDTLQINFSSTQSIGEINVFSVQDNHTAPIEPTASLTFTRYGLTAFQVQYWNGSAWLDVPGGNLSGNNLIWRRFTFAPITTNAIRVLVHSSADGATRITEVEAWTASSSGNSPPTVSLTSPTNNAILSAPATVNLSATAADSNGSVSKVEFYRDGALIATVPSNPGASVFVFNDTNVPVGTYSYTAKAYDNGTPVGMTTSAAALVSVTATSAGSVNVAAQANGGVAVASSVRDTGHAAAHAINGDRKGLNWGSTGGWGDATSTFPDTLQINFSSTQSIGEINVFSVQDNHTAPIEPTASLTFTRYGLTAFQVQYWNGSAWLDVPGGNLSGNNLIWRRFTFAPITTNAIRVLVHSSADGATRITEVEAWTASSSGNSPPTVSLTSPTNNAILSAPATVNLSATAADSNGSVSKVEFYRDGALIATVPSNPGASVFVFNDTNVPVGTYSYTAKAYDNGTPVGMTTSAAALVSVTATSAGSVNVAAQANGGVAVASSVRDTGHAAAHAINGDRKGLNWGSTGGWGDATGTFPDTLQINFSSTQSIGEINVFSVQDNHTAPIEPTASLTFTRYGLTAFQVQYWNGSAWLDVPGGNLSGNNLIWRRFTFAPITTNAIRVLVHSSADGATRITEVEAWTASSSGNSPPTVSLTSPTNNAILSAPATVNLSATAADSNGSVSKVEFYRDGALIATVPTSATAYAYNDTNLPVGTYSYTSKAYDSSGASTTSSATTVSVRTGGTSAPTTRLQISEASWDGPTWLDASKPLYYTWRNPGGDWRDSNNVAQGNNAYGSVTLNVQQAQLVRIDLLPALITRLQAENTGIYIQQPNGGTQAKIASRENGWGHQIPTLTVVTSQGTFTPRLTHDLHLDSTTNQCLGSEWKLATPAILKFDLSGVSGAVQSAYLTFYLTDMYQSSLTLKANYLDMPALVTDPAAQVGGAVAGLRGTLSESALAAHPSVLKYAVMDPAITPKDWVNYSSTAGNVTYKTWPEFNVGAARVGGQVVTITSWHLWAQPIQAGKPYSRDYYNGYDELYLNYTLMIDPNVKDGINELGVKLPGMGAGFDQIGQPNADGRLDASVWSGRLEHSNKSDAHPHVYRLLWYWYGADHPVTSPNRGALQLTDVSLVAGRKYTIEQHIKLNTSSDGGVTFNRDGIREVFVDGVLVFRDANSYIRSHPLFQIQDMPFMNIFHGGSKLPLAPIHYEIGPVVVASQYVGPLRNPNSPATAYPTWRINMSVNQMAPIPGTAPSAYNLEPAWNTSGDRLAWASHTFDAFNGLQFDTKRGTVYNSLSGGHRAVEQNGVYKVDLMVNNPGWSVVRDSTVHRGNDPANQSVPYFPSDGRPTSRHTYYNGVVVDIDGSPVIVHTDNSAPTYTGFGPSGIVDAFRIHRGDWDAAGTWQRNPGALGPGQCVAKDPRDQNIWTADRANRIWRLDTKTRTWNSVASGMNGIYAQGCLVDVIHDRIVAGNSFANPNRAFSVYNITKGTNEEKFLVDAGGLSYFRPDQSWAGLTHDTVNDRYLWVGNTGKILAIDAKTFQVSIVSDAPFPQALPHVFGRFEFIPGLGGAVYHPGWSSPLMFLPVK